MDRDVSEGHVSNVYVTKVQDTTLQILNLVIDRSFILEEGAFVRFGMGKLFI